MELIFTNQCCSLQCFMTLCYWKDGSFLISLKLSKQGVHNPKIIAFYTFILFQTTQETNYKLTKS